MLPEAVTGVQPARTGGRALTPDVTIVIAVFNEACGAERLQAREDPLLRRVISAGVSRLASAAVGVPMSDCGSMLRAYRRPVVDEVLQMAERALFIPALAAWVAQHPTEIAIGHEPRTVGR